MTGTQGFEGPGKTVSGGNWCRRGGEPRPHPPHRIGQRPIWQNPEESAAIELERFTNSTEGSGDRLIDLVGWQVDELDRQLCDEALEVELFPERSAVHLLELDARGNIYDGRHDEYAPLGFDRIESNLYRKFRAVATTTEQRAPDPHRAFRRIQHERVTVYDVRRPLGLGQQAVHDLSDEFFSNITKVPFELLVDENNPSVNSDDQHSVWCRLDGEAQNGFGRGIQPRQLVAQTGVSGLPVHRFRGSGVRSFKTATTDREHGRQATRLPGNSGESNHPPMCRRASEIPEAGANKIPLTPPGFKFS